MARVLVMVPLRVSPPPVVRPWRTMFPSMVPLSPCLVLRVSAPVWLRLFLVSVLCICWAVACSESPIVPPCLRVPPPAPTCPTRDPTPVMALHRFLAGLL